MSRRRRDWKFFIWGLSAASWVYGRKKFTTLKFCLAPDLCSLSSDGTGFEGWIMFVAWRMAELPNTFSTGNLLMAKETSVALIYTTEMSVRGRRRPLRSAGSTADCCGWRITLTKQLMSKEEKLKNAAEDKWTHRKECFSIDNTDNSQVWLVWQRLPLAQGPVQPQGDVQEEQMGEIKFMVIGDRRRPVIKAMKLRSSILMLCFVDVVL